MIPPHEHRERMERLQRLLGARGLDAYLVASEDNIFYLTGVSYRPLERPFFILVRPDAPAVLLVPEMEREHLSAAPNVSEVRCYREYPAPPGEGWPERLLELVSAGARGDRALAVEPTLPQEIAAALAPLRPEVAPLVEDLRVLKSPAELRLLRRAARHADFAVERVLAASYRGASLLELFSESRAVLRRIIREDGYEVLTSSVLMGAWPAPLSAQPHGVPRLEDRLGEGPHISLALMRVNGYAAECERTYFVAPPSAEVKALFAAMREARRRALALVRPGAACAEIDRAARDFLVAEGHGARLLHRTGHGFGLGNHERPWIAEGSAEVLAPGMLISVEPGIYIPTVGGLRHSDTFLVTDRGYEQLTRFPEDLESMTLTAAKPLARLRGEIVRRAVGIR